MRAESAASRLDRWVPLAGCQRSESRLIDSDAGPYCRDIADRDDSAPVGPALKTLQRNAQYITEDRDRHGHGRNAQYIQSNSSWLIVICATRKRSLKSDCCSDSEGLPVPVARAPAGSDSPCQ